MSIDFFTSGKQIALSQVVELTDKFENFQVEIQRGEVSKETDFMEPFTTLSVPETKKSYRISLTARPSQFEIKVFNRSEEFTTNYLWMYVDENLECFFSCYGQNDVCRIIEILEFHTSVKLFDEHTYTEMRNLFEIWDFEDEDEEKMELAS